MTPRTRLVGAALAVALVTGCGSTGTTPAAGADPHREWEVAEDPGATTDDIVAAGGPADVAVSRDGARTLVTWRADPEDDEGSSWGAWRLYDDDGGRVADGHFAQVQEQSAGIDAVAVTDGFLLLDYADRRWHHLSADGTMTDVPTSRERRAVAPDDVLLDPFSGEVWDDADEALHLLPRLPTRNSQGAAVDAGGTVHVLLPRRDGGDAVVASSPGGAGPWTRTRLELGPGGFTDGLVTAADGSVLLTALADDGDFGRPTAVHHLEPGGRWTSTSLPDAVVLGEPDVDVVDGRLLLADDDRAYLGTGNDGFDRLSLPQQDVRLVLAGDLLWALASRSTTLWSSDDAGETWDVVAR